MLLGNAAALQPGVEDAVVSLCRLGEHDVPLAGVARGTTSRCGWSTTRTPTSTCQRILADTTATIRDLRAEGRTILVRCARAETRTPVVAAAYGVLVTGSTRKAALDRVLKVLPTAWPRPSMVGELRADEQRRPARSARAGASD